jgi:hypothetical protein
VGVEVEIGVIPRFVKLRQEKSPRGTEHDRGNTATTGAELPVLDELAPACRQGWQFVIAGERVEIKEGRFLGSAHRGD